MTQTQIKPRDKLRRWASRNDLSVMPLCQILSNIERIGIDVTLGLGLEKKWSCDLSEQYYDVWNVEAEAQTPGAAVRQAIREAVKGTPA